MKMFKWLISRIRNTLCLFMAWLVVSIALLALGVCTIASLIVVIPALILFLGGTAIYLCITCWLRTGDPEWIKILTQKIKEMK